MAEKTVCETLEPHREIVEKLGGTFPATEIISGVSELFKAMGDETRVKIIWALYQSEMCVCDLTELLGLSQPAVSHQLSNLRRAHLVSARRAGKEIFYSIADDHVKMMLEAGLEHAGE